MKQKERREYISERVVAATFCHTCGSSWDGEQNPHRKAAKHARTEGHSVSVDMEVCYRYDYEQ